MSSSILFPAPGSRAAFRGDSASFFLSGGRRSMPLQIEARRLSVRASLDTQVSDMGFNGMLSLLGSLIWVF